MQFHSDVHDTGCNASATIAVIGRQCQPDAGHLPQLSPASTVSTAAIIDSRRRGPLPLPKPASTAAAAGAAPKEAPPEVAAMEFLAT